MSDYAELVGRLEGAYSTVFERSLAKQAADAIKALVQERDKEHERAEKFKWQVRDTCSRAEKAESDLAECMAHAVRMASAPNQELLNVDREAFRAWRAKQ